MGWYERRERHLPWRETSDPYAILISEILLQQTRVEVVVRRYTGFIFRFPNVFSLAQAREDVLLKEWEGLGYYARARNLHKAAKLIVERHNGRIPENREELLALPGIGPYTAAAVMAIAFGKPEAAIDSNAERIFARVLALESDPRSAEGRRQIESVMLSLMPEGRSGDFTQAVMDLGQLVCHSKQPECEVCPLKLYCRGQKAPRLYPVQRARKKKKQEDLTVALLTDGSRVAFEKRREDGLLASMYGPPMFAGRLSSKELISKLEALGHTIKAVEAIAPWDHVFTHRIWHLGGFIAEVETPLESEGLLWANEEQISSELALPTAFKPALRAFGEWKAQRMR